MNPYFYSLLSTSPITRKLIVYALSLPTKEWTCAYSVRYCHIPWEIVKQDPICMQLERNFCVHNYTIQRFRPARMYPFHRDGDRQVALNMRLMHDESYTFFRPDEDLSEREDEQVPLITVPYSPNQYMLMNVGKRHSVVNISGERLMFSMSFDKIHSYAQVWDYLQATLL